MRIQEHPIGRWAGLVLILTGILWATAGVAAERAITPDPGGVRVTATADERLSLSVNTTPRDGDQPVMEWFVFTATSMPELHILTPSGTVVYRADLDLTGVTYPFAPGGRTEWIATLSMAELDLGPGDTLSYGYAYTASDLSAIVLDNIVTVSVTEEDPSLKPMGSADALTDYLKAGLRRLGSADSYRTPYAESDVFGTTDSSAGGSPAVSGTNVQEAGVDEADTVETDGRYLYVAPPAPDVYWWGVPETDGALSDADRRGIRILALNETPPSAEPVATINLEDHEVDVDGLYLVTGRDEGRPDLLVTVGGTGGQFWGFWGYPGYFMDETTEVALYDVSEPAAPRRITRMTLEGGLVSSRRIGETLYLVTRFTPHPPDFEPYQYGPEGDGKNEAAVARATLGDLLPQATVDGVRVGSPVNPATCLMPPQDPESPEDPSLITVTALDLVTPGTSPGTATLAGPTETVYVSADRIYLATTRYTRPENADGTWTPPEPSTEVHQLALTGAGPEYRASGSVPGTLGWETDKKPFRMSHYDGTLRIATSLGNAWNGSATTRLTLLQASGGRLEETAHIDGIGEPGERLYAVRYAGTYGYLVTFRVTDPLYVFDLSDPHHPKELGALHIDGYSDYLHPVGDRFLLGVGKDALPDTSSSDFGGRGAWYQGVKLSLFDISNPADPREVDAVILGKRGTESAALTDHHAFTWLPATETRPARLALPVGLHDTVPHHSSYATPDDPWFHYDWTHTGLYLFDIDPSAGEIRSRGEMIVERRDSAADDWYWRSSHGDRSVLVNDTVHYVHDGSVWSAPWGGNPMTGPR
jgi:uncharacterized secreted protein with C-terminal beta-propeller domain